MIVNMNEELKPCPFCGGKANVLNSIELGCGFDNCFDIECGTKGCFLEFGCEWFDTKEDVIKKWNKRA